MSTDRQLLQDYVANGDQTAMTMLCDQYNGMVYSVCMKVLRNTADAEDATVATFAVLARKAAALLARESLAGWLCWCANNTARNLMRLRHRSAEREKEASIMQQFAGDDDTPEFVKTVLPALDAELASLPGIYRDVLVLQYYNGLSRSQIALQLGRPEGTVATWIRTALETLRKRLHKYRFTGSADDLDAQLSKCSLMLPLSYGAAMKLKALIETKTVSGSAGALTELTLKTIAWAQLKPALLAGSAAVLLIAGSITAVSYTPAEKAPAATEGLEDNADVLYNDKFGSGKLSSFWVSASPPQQVVVDIREIPTLVLHARSAGRERAVTSIESEPVDLAGQPLEIFWERAFHGLEPDERSSVGITILDTDGHTLGSLRWQRTAAKQSAVSDRAVSKTGNNPEKSFMLQVPKFLRVIVDPSGRIIFASKRLDMEKGDFITSGHAGVPVKSIKIRFDSAAGPGGTETMMLRQVTVRRLNCIPPALESRIR